MEDPGSKTIDVGDKTEQTSDKSDGALLAATEIAEVVKKSESDSAEQAEPNKIHPSEEVQDPGPEGSAEKSESVKAQMDSTEVAMVCNEDAEQPVDSVQNNSEIVAAMPSAVDMQVVSSEKTPTTVIKDEPTDAEMESAEDFTGKSSDFPTVPRITIKQEVPTSMQEQVAAERALESKAVLQINSSSLSLLCQYISSDSESNITDSDDEVAPRNGTTTVNNNKRRASSSSAETLSDDGVEIIPNTASYRIQDEPILVSDAETTATGMNESSDELSADEEDAPQARPPIKSKGEVLVNELPPIEDLQISVPEAECKPIGHVESIVAQIVIVQSYAGVELLDLETVLFLDKGQRALGKIFDVIGQVTAPMYCVLFNNRNDVVRKGITVGMPVYCAPQTEHTSFIILSDLMKHKGSDASWLDDNEAPDHALEYSDDEQERNARRRRRGSCSSSGRVSPEAQYQPYHLPSYPSRRGYGRGNGGGGGGYRGRGRGRGHSWHTNLPQQPPQMQQPQRVLNPFAFAAGVPPPPPPPAPPGGSN